MTAKHPLLGLRAPYFSDDVLYCIFLLASDVDPPRKATDSEIEHNSLGWITLTHVCTQWRRVGLSMRLLWASIASFFRKREIAEKLASRAGSCPLNLNVTGWDGEPSIEQRRMFDWVVENVHRAGTLCSHGRAVGNTVASTIRDALDGRHLPALRCIQLAFNPNDGKDSEHFLELDAPALTTAILDGIMPVWSSCMRNLCVLHLRLQRDLPKITSSCIIDTLQATPGLQCLVLRLEHCICIDELDVRHTSPETVNLNHLTRLRVYTGDVHCACELLESITAPESTALDIGTASSAGLHRLIGHSVRPYIGQRLYDAAQLSAGSLYFIQADSEARDDIMKPIAVFSLTFPKLDTIEYAEVLNVTAETYTSVLSAIRECEISSAENIDDDWHQTEDPAITAAFGQAIQKLGRELISAKRITISFNTWDYLSPELIASLTTPDVIPAAKELSLLVTDDEVTMYTNQQSDEYGDAIEQALKQSKAAGRPIVNMFLSGTCCPSSSLTQWRLRAMRYRTLGLIQHWIDHRKPVYESWGS